MPIGSSNGSKPTEDYTKLKTKIEKLNRLRQRNVFTEIGDLIYLSYPQLWSAIESPVHGSTNGGKVSRRGFDKIYLLEILNLPTFGICEGCQKRTGLVGKSFMIARVCSKSCMNKSLKVKKKKVSSYIERTGYSNPSQNPQVKDQKIKTYLEKTDGKYDHPLRDPSVKAESARRYREKTGFDSPNQVPEIHLKQVESARKIKHFVDHKGRVFKCRGYEPIILSLLDKHPLVKRFTTTLGDDLLPSFRYEKEGTNHWYMPDIGVLLKDGRRLVIEVKSTYTLNGRPNWERWNKAKFKAADRDLGGASKFWLALVHSKCKIEWVSSNSRHVQEL